jgi:methylenetetrahydrofolate--tRNA-(uracil-5-)-methyltransferase
MTAAPITVVGAGLAGCEAAVQLARRGIAVRLCEMKPAAFSPAHCLPGPAELVCSNSLKSDDPLSAHGLLKTELRRLGSVVLMAADRSRVPAGTALAVDRQEFSELIASSLREYPSIEYRPGVIVEHIPEGMVVIATGPLTPEPLANDLLQATGTHEAGYFYDALAPIVEGNSIDMTRVFAANRWDKSDTADYLNCPLTQEQYQRFLQALRAAPHTPLHSFEDPRYFEGCLPIEVLAERGDNTLAFGPMRPVGLATAGRRPYAVVQLRSENRARSAYNVVGFQTKLTYGAQLEVFRMIPGLEQAVFLRYGAIHRNFYLNAPAVLDDALAVRTCSRIRVAGQISGVEGYVESAAIGLLVGRMLASALTGTAALPPARETAIGSLYAHLRGRTGAVSFEPMNIHFGLLPEAQLQQRRIPRVERRRAVILRAHEAFEQWVAQTQP